MSFNMKKIGTVSMTAAALLAASWGVQAATTDSSPSAKVKITATVQGSTCTPEWTLTDTQTVSLGKVADTALSAVGDVGATQPFTLSVNNCDSGVTKVNVWAVGTQDTADNTAFKNAAASGADGVAVTLWGGNDQSTQLTPDGTGKATYTVTDGAATMTFLAKLERSAAVATGGVTDGAVESTATLYMGYE